MTKKMESRPREALPEVYRLAVILVICVIGGSGKGSMSMCERRMSITEEELQVTQVSYPKAYFTPLNLREAISSIGVIDSLFQRYH